MLWKLGQCWPCMEYAIVDYYLRPMMALAYVTEAMKPVATSFRHEPQDDAALEVFVVNDRWDEIDGRLTVVAAELDSAGGPQLVEVIGDVVLTVPADRSLGAMSFPPSRFDPERVVFFSRFASRETSYGAYSLRPKAAYDLLRVSGFSLSASMQSLAPLHLARSTAGPGAARTFE